MNGSMDRVFDLLHPMTAYYKPQWDPHIEEGDCLQELNDVIKWMQFFFFFFFIFFFIFSFF